MRKQINTNWRQKSCMIGCMMLAMFYSSPMYAFPVQEKASVLECAVSSGQFVTSARKINPTTIEVLFSNNRRLLR